jgi:hypothetical protein
MTTDENETKTEETAAPVDHGHGSRGYYIAPDSAEPWPDSVLRNVDIKAAETAAEQVHNRELESRKARSDNTLPGRTGAFVQARDVAVIGALAGPMSAIAAARFQPR